MQTLMNDLVASIVLFQQCYRHEGQLFSLLFAWQARDIDTREIALRIGQSSGWQEGGALLPAAERELFR